VIAGYPWFTDWGRDTMISLPGLCLTTKRFDVAREILHSFAGAVHDGLLPNRFADGGQGAEYNTVDASLWFFHAIYAYAQASDDWAFAQAEMLPVLKDILAHHIAGTDYGIGVDAADGLLRAGQSGVQLTWMDAKVGDWVVTPRQGKPVEINALWHNALCITADLSRRAGDSNNADDYAQRAAQVQDSFARTFWNPATQTLFDVIDPDGHPDASVRPNQIFAASLPFPVVDDPAQAKTIVDQVRQLLLTPCGLRTLAPGAPGYQPHYGPGDQAVRDAAYHQGTVWPWLLGAFIDAHLKVYNDKAAAAALLAPLLKDGLPQYGVGTVGEIFDADPPHAPNGCPAQAWSVAELLRALVLVS
jgi:predicted glycogen debranching enzyme